MIGASVVVVVATVDGGSGEVDVVDGFAGEVVGTTMTSAGDDTAAMPRKPGPEVEELVDATFTPSDVVVDELETARDAAVVTVVGVVEVESTTDVSAPDNAGIPTKATIPPSTASATPESQIVNAFRRCRARSTGSTRCVSARSARQSRGIPPKELLLPQPRQMSSASRPPTICESPSSLWAC